MTTPLRLESSSASRVSPGKLARLMDVSPATVLGWATAGCPRHPDGTFLVADVVAWRIAWAAEQSVIRARLQRAFEGALESELPKFEAAIVAARSPQEVRRVLDGIHAALMRPLEAEATRMTDEKERAVARPALTAVDPTDAAGGPQGVAS